jgi:hypothetical protein
MYEKLAEIKKELLYAILNNEKIAAMDLKIE